MVQESRIQEQHQPICLQNPQKPDISNIPTNPERNNNNKWKDLAIGKRIYNKNTIFVRYRQGSDGAAQVGDECTHGSIVEFEKLGLQILIGHRVFFQFENWEIERVCAQVLISELWENRILFQVSQIWHKDVIFSSYVYCQLRLC